MKTKQSGMTLIEIMMAMGLLAVLSLGVMRMMNQMNKANLRATAVTQAQQLRQNFFEIVNNPVAWNNTLKDTTNIKLTCLRTNADCTGEQNADFPRPFVLHDPSDKIFYNGMQADAGFTLGGAACTGYPSSGCPFHVDLSWRAFCEPNLPCVSPSIEVSGTVQYTPGTQDRVIAYNPANYSFKQFKQNQFALIVPSPTPTDGSAPAVDTAQQQRDPASAAPGAAQQAPGGLNDQQIDMICGAMGENINNPAMLAQIKAQVAGMGMGAAANSFIETLPQTCAARASGQ